MKILHLEDNPADAELVYALLRDELPLCEVTIVSTSEEFLAQLHSGNFDVVLSDFNLNGFDGREALRLTQQHCSETPFVFLSGSIGEELAVETLRAGAHDYVLKDRMKRLPSAIRHAVDEARERRNRQAAEEAQIRLVDILENTTDFVGVCAPDGRMLYVNRAGLRLVGLAEKTEVSKLLVHDFHPADFGTTLMRDSFAEATRIGTWAGETLLLTHDGRTIPVSQVVIAHRSADTGKVGYFSTVMRDLTAQYAAIRRIREQADILNKAHDAITISDLDSRFTYWNQGAERIFGWTADETIGHTDREVFSAAISDQLDLARRQVEKSGEWRGELQLINKQGQPVVVETSFTTICDDAGRPQARLSISTDISEKRKLQEQFLRAQRLESIGMLAAGIAHDLNNVLTPMLLAVPMLRETASSAEDRELLVSLEEGTKRGAALVRQILGFVRGVAGVTQVMDVTPQLRDIAGIIHGTFPKNIRLQDNISPRLPSVKANPTQIHQVLLNLAVNARDAMPEGGTLRLRAERRVLDELAAQAIPGGRPGAFLAIEVEDTGTGIPPEVLARIWEPFFTTKDPDKGTGLGLSTVRGIADSHGGFITVRTALGNGTTFSVYLPDAQAVSTNDAAGSTSFNVPRGNGELVLVVDDEAPIRDIATATLAHHGYRVLAARDGTEAVALFAPRSREIQLVITDLHMPNLDGAALAGIARRMNPSVKIIATSGLSDEVNHGSPSGARAINAFLPKPFTVESLLSAVYEQLLPAECVK